MNEYIKAILVAIACSGLIAGFVAFVAILVWICMTLIHGIPSSPNGTHRIPDAVKSIGLESVPFRFSSDFLAEGTISTVPKKAPSDNKLSREEALDDTVQR